MDDRWYVFEALLRKTAIFIKLETVLNTSQEVPHLIFPIILWGKFHYYPKFYKKTKRAPTLALESPRLEKHPEEEQTETYRNTIFNTK